MIPVGNKGLVIEKVDGPNHIKVVEEFGYEMYLHCGAIRKVLLAYQSPSFIEEYVKNCPDAKLKVKIDATVTAYYDGDYSKLVSYKGEAATVEGWGKGGAIQYEFSLTVEQLEGLGLLREIK